MFLTIEGAPPGGGRTERFAYLWAKHVTGFNPRHHCMACFIGPKDGTVKRGLTNGTYPIDIAAPYFYICGVSGISWTDNLHFAVRPKQGSTAMADSVHRVRFIIENAEQITIPPLPPGFGGLSHKYTTCRNFQFGVAMFGYNPPEQASLFAAPARKGRGYDR